MAWIESHQELARHPKILRLSRTLKINKAQAIGHLHLLWWWTLDFSPTGELSAFTSCEICGAAEWQGDEDRFVEALKETGWIDGDGKLHDWHDYAGRLIEERDWKRKRDREYQKERRQRLVNDSPTNRGATQPNSTLPNPTVHGVEKKLSTVVALGFRGVQGGKVKGNDFSISQENQAAVDDAVEFSGDEGSRAFFQKAVKAIGPGLVREAIGEVKMRGENVSSKAKYLCALLSEWMKSRV